MSATNPIKKGKKTTKNTEKLVPEKQPIKSKYAPQVIFKTSRHYDPYPPRKTPFVGTVYQAVEKKKIVLAYSLMPVEFLKTLYYQGWILKKNARYSKYSNKTLGSLHPNENLSKTMAEKHEAGLVWTNDLSTSHVQWSKLKPWVMVNRFPRDGYPEIKLCGLCMLGKSEYEDKHPRTYPNTTAECGFMEDFALTACVSLLRAFVDKKIVNKETDRKILNNRFGGNKIPLSALRFAVEKCRVYLAQDKLDDFVTGQNVDDGWKTFFNNYRKIVNGKHHFTTARSRKSDYEEERRLNATARILIKRVIARRPQTKNIDGYRNIWILKTKRPAKDESMLFNDIEHVLKLCPGLNSNANGAASDDYVVQKYVETPLLNNGHKFMLHAWVVISTLDEHLSVWLYSTLTMQTSVYEFSLDINGNRYSPNDHLMQRLDRMHSDTQTVELRLLRSKLYAMLGVDHGTLCKNVVSKIKSSIRTAIIAAADDGNILKLRPNCFELFQATFVVGNNLWPWLINIRSDPTPVHSIKYKMQFTMGRLAKDMARIVVCKNRESKTEIGKFQLIHKDLIPGPKYEPRDFVVVSVPKKSKNYYRESEHDYIEGFLSDNSDSSIESTDDDTENDIETDSLKIEPLQHRVFDGQKVDLELSITYVRMLDRVQKNLEIIREMSSQKKHED